MFFCSGLARAGEEKSAGASYNHLFAIRNIEGWTVKIGPGLQGNRAYADEVCKLLHYKLHLVKRYMPEKALVALRKVPIWLEKDNPDNFRQWQNLQPSIVLHHLARAHFDRVVKADCKDVTDALKKAVQSGKYDRVLRFDGKYVRHPALSGAEEYFAEMSESYYGFNDRYPFLQFALSQLDPEACRLLARLWGGKAK